MNPYPFDALNHFTVPRFFDTAADLELEVHCFSWSGPGLPSAGTSLPRKKRPQSLSLQPFETIQKVIQEQQTLFKAYHENPILSTVGQGLVLHRIYRKWLI